MIDKEHDRILRSLTRAQLRLLHDVSLHGLPLYGAITIAARKLISTGLGHWINGQEFGLTRLGEAVRASYLAHGIVDRRTVAGRQPKWK